MTLLFCIGNDLFLSLPARTIGKTGFNFLTEMLEPMKSRQKYHIFRTKKNDLIRLSLCFLHFTSTVLRLKITITWLKEAEK